MNPLILTKDEFENYRENTIITSREAHFYFYNKFKLIKDFSEEEDFYEDFTNSFLKNKINTINYLLSHKKELENIHELVLPEKIVKVDNTEIGYLMPYIKQSISLENIIKKNNTPLKTKIKYLKQVGILLEKINSLNLDIHIGDLHEGNILITPDKKIHLIDTDSLYTPNAEIYCSKFLFLNKNLYSKINKYPTDDYKTGFIIPSQNSDIYCYIIMVLNTITFYNSYTISEKDFFNYLDYLENINVSIPFLECISKIYKNENNVSPLPYLDDLNIKNLKQTSYKTYLKRTGK